MDLSDDGFAFLVRWEGRANRAYEDALGHCTVGVGHLLHPGPCTDDEKTREWTDAEVDELLRTDLAHYVAAVNRAITVPLAQRQFDALVSFAFNWGVGQRSGFGATSVLRLVNEGDFAAAAANLVNGAGPNGRPYDKGLPGVRARRIAEAERLVGEPVKFVSRAEWGARPPRSTTATNNRLRGVACHWEGPRMGWPWIHDLCAVRVKSIQAFHMDTQGWNDIAYNALVCGHGYVFAGRGPGVRSGANGDAEVNATHYAICYLGGEGDEFTAEARQGFNDAAEWLGMADGEWLGHRDLTSTACPGDDIYAWAHGGHPSTPDEEDFMAALTPDEQKEVLDKVRSIDDNTNDIGGIVFASLGGGNWEDGARRFVRAVELIEHSGGGSEVDIEALAERVADKLAERLSS